MDRDEKIVLASGLLTLSLSIYLFAGTLQNPGGEPMAIYLYGPDKSLIGSAHPGATFFYCTGTNPASLTFPVVPGLTKVSATWANPNQAEQDTICQISTDGSSWISPVSMDISYGEESETLSIIPWTLAENTEVLFRGCPCIGMLSYVTFDASAKKPAEEILCGGSQSYCCSDRKDNDEDGTSDCADPDCLDSPVCKTGGGIQITYAGEGDCTDGIDGEDPDLDVDCDDDECATDHACVPLVHLSNRIHATWGCVHRPDNAEVDSLTLSKTTTVGYIVNVNHPSEGGTPCDVFVVKGDTSFRIGGGNARSVASGQPTLMGSYVFDPSEPTYKMRFVCKAATKEITINVPASVTTPLPICPNVDPGSCELTLTPGAAECSCSGTASSYGTEFVPEESNCYVGGMCSGPSCNLQTTESGCNAVPGCVWDSGTSRCGVAEGFECLLHDQESCTSPCTWDWDDFASGDCTCIESPVDSWCSDHPACVCLEDYTKGACGKAYDPCTCTYSPVLP